MSKKTLVIHPADETTNMLSVIYAGKDWTVITEDVSWQEIEKQLWAHDRIIMLGHGDKNGLFGHGHYMIGTNQAEILAHKECIFVWCYANEYVMKHGLKGFYTGMIISEHQEARYCAVKNFTAKDIDESNEIFSDAVKQAIDVEDKVSLIKELYVPKDNPIMMFNAVNIFQR